MITTVNKYLPCFVFKRSLVQTPACRKVTYTYDSLVSVPTHKWCNSTIDAMATSFHTFSDSLFTIILQFKATYFGLLPHY